MGKENKEKKGFSRRDFLKSMAAGVGVGVLGVYKPLIEPALASAATSTATPAGSDEERVPGYCGPGDWLGKAPVIDESKISTTVYTDVVVVGGGHAGVLAAVGAVDEGKTVAVIETQPWSAFVTTDGSNAGGWNGSDIGNVNSKFLSEKGFGPYNTGEICYEFVKRSLGRCNPDIIKAFVQNSGAMFDRMVEIYEAASERRKRDDSAVKVKEDIYGNKDVVVDFSNMLEAPCFNIDHQYYNDTQYPIMSGDFKTWPSTAQFYGYQANNIEYFEKYMVYYCLDKGATWWFEHTGIVLTQNANGDVTGVIAKDLKNNVYKKFVATKGVVLAAGDFIGNPAMCWALLNEGMEWAERGGKTAETWAATSIRNGQGHKMGCWAGGVIEPTPRGWMLIGGGVGGPWGSHPFLQLNSQGKRFYNEAGMVTAGAISWRQAPGLACCVTDTKIKDSLFVGGLEHGAPDFGNIKINQAFFDSLDALLTNSVDDPKGGQIRMTAIADNVWGTAYAASTLDKLADLLGYTGEAKQNFLASIAHYNELCNSQEGDTDYGKDKKFMLPIDKPPFIGAKSSLSNAPSPMMVTLSGLITDDKQHVVKGGDLTKPIKGLYACGNCLGGRYGLGYTTPMAGNSVGMAMTHGWLAGKYAAAGI